MIRIPERGRSAQEVLEAARAARHDPRWRVRQWIARAGENAGAILDLVERHGLEGLSLLGRYTRVALWRSRRKLRHLAIEATKEDSLGMRLLARAREFEARRTAQRGLLAPLPRRISHNTHNCDFDRAETRMTTNPSGTETGSA